MGVNYRLFENKVFKMVLSDTHQSGGMCLIQVHNLRCRYENFSVNPPLFNPLKTKRRLLYLKTQFVPRSKHFSSRL